MNTITKTDNFKRVDITLPRETVKLLESISKKGDRSRLVDQAIRFYAKEMSRANLRKLVKEGAIENAARDLSIAQEWFPLENETWSKE